MKHTSFTLLFSCLLLCLGLAATETHARTQACPILESTLRLQITNTQQQAIENAYVVVYRKKANEHLRIGEGVSNAQGQFSLVQAKGISYGYLTVVAPGYVPQEINYHIDAHDVQLQVVLQAKSGLSLMNYSLSGALQGNDQQKQAFVLWLASYQPDVLVFQDLDAFTEAEFTTFAQSYGHSHTTFDKTMGIGISSSSPLSGVRKVSTNQLFYGYLHAVVNGTHLYALRLCPYSLSTNLNPSRINRRKELEIILADAAQYSQEPCLLVGNLHSHAASDAEAFGVGYRFENEDFGAISDCLSATFTDSYAFLHPSFKPSFLVQDDKLHVGSGGRTQYALLNWNLKHRCGYSDIVHTHFTDTLSEHYPLFVYLKEPQAAHTLKLPTPQVSYDEEGNTLLSFTQLINSEFYYLGQMNCYYADYAGNWKEASGEVGYDTFTPVKGKTTEQVRLQNLGINTTVFCEMKVLPYQGQNLVRDTLVLQAQLKVKAPEDILFTTYNIEYDRAYSNPPATENMWVDRCPAAVGVITQREWDLVGLQEVTYEQLNKMLPTLPEFAFKGLPVTGSLTNYRTLANFILYKTSRFQIMQTGIFWFSTTPYTPNSKSWDSYSVRNCNWMKVKDLRTNKIFYHFNLHLDHIGGTARTNSITLLLEKVPEIAGEYPAIINGDFNLTQYDQTNYSRMSKGPIFFDARDLAPIKKNANSGTFNYYSEPKSDSRIDHILIYRPELVNVRYYEIVADKFNGVIPSDHHPVTIKLDFK